MNKTTFKAIMATVGVFAFLIAFGWAGDMDFTDQVILYMSQEEYDTAKAQFTEHSGREPSEREIAHWFIDHQE